MKTLAESMQMHGGIFLLVQVILIVLILILSIRKYIAYYGKAELKKSPFVNSHHAVLFLGIFGLAWGFFTQLLGFIQALNAIIEAADVSPEIIIMGLRNSFINPAIGLATVIVSALFWAILHGMYTRAVAAQDQTL